VHAPVHASVLRRPLRVDAIWLMEVLVVHLLIQGIDPTHLCLFHLLRPPAKAFRLGVT